MFLTQPDPDLVDALRLRDWVRSTLIGPRPDAPPPPAGAAAWTGMLRAERCAAPLSRHLQAAGGSIPEAGADALRRRTLAETRRILSLAAQLRTVAGAAAEAAVPVVVLKGGVPLLRGEEGFDAADLDVLVRSSDDAERLARSLGRRGHAPAGPRTEGRIEQQVAPGAVQVEIHFELDGFGPDVWADVRSIEGHEWLAQLAPADHLWHLLLHGSVQHPERRSRTRDLLLVRRALAACPMAERAEVERRARLHPSPGPADMLAAAEGRPEPVRHVALAALRIIAEGWPARRISLRQRVFRAAVARVAAEALPRVGVDAPTVRPLLARLRAIAPPVAAGARRGVWIARSLIVRPWAAALAREAEAAARRVRTRTG